MISHRTRKKMSEMPIFKLKIILLICSTLIQLDAWKALSDSTSPQTERYPLPWGEEGKLTRIQQLIILRCLRPDKVRQKLVIKEVIMILIQILKMVGVAHFSHNITDIFLDPVST